MACLKLITVNELTTNTVSFYQKRLEKGLNTPSFLGIRVVNFKKHCVNKFVLKHSKNSNHTTFQVRASLSGADSNFQEDKQGAENEEKVVKKENVFQKWQTNVNEVRKKIAKLGLSAVLAYGIFDGITYTTFFILAFLGYEKSTGNNPAANIKALLGIVVLMWTGNNVTRPFRVAGAAALAPLIDKWLKRLQEYLKFPSLFSTFLLVVVLFASVCFSIVGLLILSRVKLA